MGGWGRVAGYVRDTAGDFPLLHVHYSWRLATVQPATLPCAARRPSITPTATSDRTGRLQRGSVLSYWEPDSRTSHECSVSCRPCDAEWHIPSMKHIIPIT